MNSVLRAVGDYGQFVARAGFVALATAVGCLIVVFAGLFFGMPAQAAAIAIAIAAVVVTSFWFLALPLIIGLELAMPAQAISTIRRHALVMLRVLFGLFVFALLVFFIPPDGDPTLKVLYVFLLMLIAFGISIKAVDITWEQVRQVSQLKLLTLLFLVSAALTLPRTGDAVAKMRVRIDNALGGWLSGPVLPTEQAQQQLNCNNLPPRFFTETGAPLVWFARMTDGRLDYFDRPGHHPRRNIELTPVQRDEDVQAILQQCAEERADGAARLKSEEATKRQAIEEQRRNDELALQKQQEQARADATQRSELEEKERIATAAAARQRQITRRAGYVNAATAPGASLVVAFAPSTDPRVEALVTRAVNGLSGVFTPTFFADGMFARIYGGDLSALDGIPLNRYAAVLACQSTRTMGQADAPDPSLKRSEVRLTCRHADLKAKTSRLIDVRGVGAGFTDDDATRLGVDRAAQALRDQLK